MARRFDEDTILQLLLADSEEENSSDSDKEDHIEVDPAYESVSEDDNELTLLSYKPKPQKVVFLLSTCDEEGKIDESSKKPTMVEFYNQTKGGVDTLDQICSLASCSRKTRRWPLCNFYGMLNIAFINSYIVYVTNNIEANKKPLSRREYLKSLHHKLVEPHMQKRILVPTLHTGLRDSITRILNMPGSSRSSLTLETEEREAAGPPIAKKKKFVPYARQQNE